MQALARANRVRLARAELKRSIGRGEVDVAGVIEDVPWETESMTLAELLTSQRRWGRTRARKLLQTLALSENKRVGTPDPAPAGAAEERAGRRARGDALLV